MRHEEHIVNEAGIILIKVISVSGDKEQLN